MTHFTIYGRLPTYNEYIKECRKNVYCGAKFKAESEELVLWSLGSVAGERFKKVIIHYEFYEEKANRDKDNIFSYACKVIQDALVTSGVLENDGWKQIENFTHEFYIDKDNPRIEVYIEEIEE